MRGRDSAQSPIHPKRRRLGATAQTAGDRGLEPPKHRPPPCLTFLRAALTITEFVKGHLTMPEGKGLLIVYTGPGKGKTTCALGTAFRDVGQGLRVLMV